jgi:YD repeat-containing protein
VTRTIDPRSKSTYFSYAAGGCSCGGTGQLTKVTDALANETEFHYNENGNRTKVIDALDRETDYSYDNMNRLTQIISPSGSATVSTFASDILGQMTSATDFEGKTTTYAYDHLGRQTQETYPGSLGSVSYTYDSAGNLSTVTDAASQTTDYDYDSNQRLTAVNYHHGKTTKYAYDTYGRMTKVGAGRVGYLAVTLVVGGACVWGRGSSRQRASQSCAR